MSKSKDIKGKLQISTYDDILLSSQGELGSQSINETSPKANGNEVVNISLEQLHEFKNHPFMVKDDEKMQELVESVSSKGVVSPIIVRAREEGGYEIISGHRRKRASELAGLTTIPAIVKTLDDNEAVMEMVDANIQRENVLPSERAKAFKMRMDAEKKQGSRKKTTSRQVVEKLAADKIGEDNGTSGRQVNRYIRLNSLLPELLTYVDSGKISFTPAVKLSFLSKEEQGWVLAAIDKTGKTVSLKQADELKELSEYKDLSVMKVFRIISGTPSVKRNVTLTEKDLKQYFPDNMDSIQIKEFILGMLEQRRVGGNDNAE